MSNEQVPDEHSNVPLGEKFGAPPDQWADLVGLAIELGLPVVGVSFHCGSGNHDPSSYVQAIHLAKEALVTIANIQHHIRPWLLDIGGGYPGLDGSGGDNNRFSCRQTLMDKTDTWLSINHAVKSDGDHESTAHIANAVTPLLDELFTDNDHIRFVAEPGRYFVEAAFALCSRIYNVMKVEKEDQATHFRYFIAHGVQGVFKDKLLCDETFTPQALRVASASIKSTEVFHSTVHGPSGEDYDVICSGIELPQLQIGDWLLFDRMGAYTLSIASRSGQPPVRYVY